MYVSTIKGTLKKKKKSVKDFLDDVHLICFLIFFIKAYVVGTHLNCIDKSMQFKWVPTACAFIKKYTKSTLAVIWRLRNCLACFYRGMCGNKDEYSIFLHMSRQMEKSL